MACGSGVSIVTCRAAPSISLLTIGGLILIFRMTVAVESEWVLLKDREKEKTGGCA